MITFLGSVLGQGALILSPLFLKSLDRETPLVFWLSTGLIGLNFADQLLKALVAAMVRTNSRVQAGASEAANRVGSFSLLGLPVGMLLALILTEVFYDVRHTYFVNDELALRVCH